MKELINNELAQLQKDLENLQSASKQISQAGEAAQNAIEAVNNVREDFAQNLTKITDLYSDYLKQANADAAVQSEKTADAFKQTCNSQAALLTKYQEIINNIKNETSSQLSQSLTNQKVALENMIKLAQEQTANQDAQLKKSAAATETKITEINKAHLKQVEDTDKLLASYLELAQSTAELKTKIEKIDFPERFDKLSALISALNYEQQDGNKQLKQLNDIVSNDTTSKLIASQNRKIKTIKFLAWLSTIVILLTSGAALYLGIRFGLIPDMFLR